MFAAGAYRGDFGAETSFASKEVVKLRVMRQSRVVVMVMLSSVRSVGSRARGGDSFCYERTTSFPLTVNELILGSLRKYGARLTGQSSPGNTNAVSCRYSSECGIVSG